MLDRAELLRFQAEQDNKRREFEVEQEARQTTREDARDKTMRDREDKRDRDAKSRHDDQMSTLRGNHRRELLAFGGVLVLATIVAGFIQADWTPQPGWLQHPDSWWPFEWPF